MLLYLFCFICLFYSPLSIALILPTFLFLSNLFGEKKAVKTILIVSVISILLVFLTNHDSLTYRLEHDIYGVYHDIYKSRMYGIPMMTQDAIFTNINWLNLGIVGIVFYLFASIKKVKQSE